VRTHAVGPRPSHCLTSRPSFHPAWAGAKASARHAAAGAPSSASAPAMEAAWAAMFVAASARTLPEAGSARRPHAQFAASSSDCGGMNASSAACTCAASRRRTPAASSRGVHARMSPARPASQRSCWLLDRRSDVGMADKTLASGAKATRSPAATSERWNSWSSSSERAGQR